MFKNSVATSSPTTKDIRLLTGNANPRLAAAIAQTLDKPLTNALVARFPDNEIRVKIDDDVRGHDCFIIQSTCPPVNENLMELLILIDCLKRASAGRVTAVIPYFGYARQDRKDEGRVPITAKLCANLIATAGCDRVLTMDLHAAQIQGFFDLPVDHLFAAEIFLEYIKTKKLKDVTILGPDIGSSKRAGYMAKRLNCPLALIDKRRLSPEHTAITHVIGSVDGKDVIIPDDMIATGGSIVQAANTAREQGARRIFICATHAVLSGNAVERLSTLDVEEVCVADTIPTEGKDFPRLNVLTTKNLFAEAIWRIHHAESLSMMFRGSG